MATLFEKFTLLHVPYEQNERVNLLSKLASTQRGGNNRSIIHERIGRSTIEELIREASKYTLMGEHLYKRGFSFPLLKFLDEDESRYGVCGTHIGGRALESKVARASYYWLTLKCDCIEYVCKDTLGLARTTTLGHVTLAVPKMGQYFTKWVEAELFPTISTERFKSFYWKKLICRFGLLAKIVSDNGMQFASWSIANFYHRVNLGRISQGHVIRVMPSVEN
ncbi:hypothetical protein CR513_49463, partial [Mucuna pruriens]